MTARLRVSHEALSHNLAEIRRRIAPAQHMLVVKDDAYGHGLEAVVVHAWSEGVRWFGAFDVRTGMSVREVLGADARVFVWIVASADEARAAVDAGLDIGVGDAALLEDLGTVDGIARVHLKIDSGLHRNGVRPEEWRAFAARAAQLQGAGRIEVVGVWSHIAEASDDEDDRAHEEFERALDVAREVGLRPQYRHLAASAAGFARPGFRYDLVRIGAFAYGIRPAGGPSEDELGIRPIASLVAEVSRRDRDEVVLEIGSLDGLPSTLARQLSVATASGPRLIRAILDDETVVESWPEAQPGDEVVILGAGALFSATDAAESIGTIGEEIAVRISSSVARDHSD